jgi:Uncharacterised protein conserved in bacteria (DUF2336)
MMEPPSAFPGLEDLVDLGSGSQIDMRPTLLRVLTDLYLQRPAHTPEDERYYTELALRLIDATDLAARAALAERLASYPSAPRAVIERLARDKIEVATPILDHSSCLTSADLESIAKEHDGAHAGLIAKRRSTVSLRVQAPGPQDRIAPAEACELSELFYAAGAPERRLILISLDYAPIAPLQPSAFMQRADTWRLEAAALQHNTEAVVRELESTLGISRAQARRVISDESGEPIVVAAKAMDLPADVVQRVLLFMNPRIGQSVDRVYELADLYGEISVDAARRLIAIWREADKDERSMVLHQSVAWRTAAENARRALSEVSRRPTHSQDMRLRGGKR